MKYIYRIPKEGEIKLKEAEQRKGKHALKFIKQISPYTCPFGASCHG